MEECAVKTRRFALALAVFLASCWGLAARVQATAPQDFLVRQYTIQLEVDDLENTLAALLRLPGVSLSSNMNVPAGTGRVTLSVLNHNVPTVMRGFAQMGEITGSSSQARNDFAAFSAVSSELAIRQMEHTRLMELLYNAGTLAQFRTIENRLRVVIAEVEQLQGQQNHLASARGNTTIEVSFTVRPAEVESPEPEPEPEQEPEEGAFRRIGRVFMESAGMTLAFWQGLLVVLSYISIPLVAMGLLALAAWLSRRAERKRRTSQLADYMNTIRVEATDVTSETEVVEVTDAAETTENVSEPLEGEENNEA